MPRLLPFFILVLFFNISAFAQEPMQGDSAQIITDSVTPPPVVEEPAEPKPREYEDMPQVRLRILDKVRAESRTYDLNVGRTVAYANIRIRPRACRTSSPLDDPEDAAFLQIWEVKPDGASAWIFSGWMFASSPSLSAMDHPVYDVTVLDCKNPLSELQSQSKEQTPPAEDVSDEEFEDDESMNDTPDTDSAVPSSE